MNMRITSGSGDSRIINSVSPGTLGPYRVTVSNITLDESVCDKYPSSGSASFVKNGITGVVTFTGACDGSYSYTER